MRGPHVLDSKTVLVHNIIYANGVCIGVCSPPAVADHECLVEVEGMQLFPGEGVNGKLANWH